MDFGLKCSSSSAWPPSCANPEVVQQAQSHSCNEVGPSQSPQPIPRPGHFGTAGQLGSYSFGAAPNLSSQISYHPPLQPGSSRIVAPHSAHSTSPGFRPHVPGQQRLLGGQPHSSGMWIAQPQAPGLALRQPASGSVAAIQDGTFSNVDSIDSPLQFPHSQRFSQ